MSDPAPAPPARPDGDAAAGAYARAAERVAAGADAHDEARALVALMTLPERLGCLDGDVPFWPGWRDMEAGGYYLHPFPAASVPRLGVPGLRFADGPRGVVVGNGTCFPVSMARAATFDPGLEERVGDAIGREVLAAGADFFGGVCVNLLRHPAWGRAQETYGEDPHLLGEMGAALTRGVQRHAMACVKHFALNSMENARFTVDVTVDERSLHEVYLPHFKRVVDEGVASVMSAYNMVNGTWCGQSRHLLTTVLREEWGFDGVVVSDFVWGLRDPVDSVTAGLDVEMPFRQQRAWQLPQAVADGRLGPETVAERAVQVVATLLRFAHLRPGGPVAAPPPASALAREVAQRSIVLLRNEGGLLPVDPAATRRVAVLGALARVANLGDGGSSDVHPVHAVTVLEGLVAALPGARVEHSDDDHSIADEADVALVVVGYTKADEGEFVLIDSEVPDLYPPLDHPELGDVAQADRPDVHASAPDAMSPGGDRRSLRLSARDEALVAAVRARNPRTVVAVMAGSAVVMPWADTVDAVLLLWYPGMEGGHALADVLTGTAPPGGRLPFAVPRDEADLPPFDPFARSVTYGPLHGQWHLDAQGCEAAFPFGFGLTTTTTRWDDVRVAGDPDAGLEVVLTVTNTGPRTADEVVQVYGGYRSSAFTRPARRLCGFAAVRVEPGGSAEVRVPVGLDPLRVRDGGAMRLEAGDVELHVARHAADRSTAPIPVRV